MAGHKRWSQEQKTFIPFNDGFDCPGVYMISNMYSFNLCIIQIVTILNIVS